MADEKQSYANHTRWDPGFHFFLAPVALITAGVVISHAYSVPTSMNLWACVVAIAALYGVFKIRLYALKVQDRVIRLEERLRLAVDNADVGFWDVDVVNDVLIWPPRTKAMFGIVPAPRDHECRR